MKTFRFRDFNIYKKALVFRKLVRSLLDKFPAEEKYRLADQIHSACQSIILNIAEGSAKKSDRDFRRFLEISIASLNEVVAGFDCAREDQIITLDEYETIEKHAEELARMIGGFMKALSRKS